MDNQAIEYRNIHAVIPQLDFVNYENPLDMIPKTQVIYSRFASLSNPITPKAGKIASATCDIIEGSLHMSSGNGIFGLGTILAGAINVGAGVVDPATLGVNQMITQEVQELEARSWDRLNFLRTFLPAQGILGERILADGSGDELHCGNGHVFFDNGDYFEGFFMDGEINNGLYIYNTGARYLGQFFRGNRTGEGIMIYDGGEYYFGDSFDNLRDGDGAMWYKDGMYYGMWKKDMRDGIGFCKYDDGTFFDGEWKNDIPIR